MHRRGTFWSNRNGPDALSLAFCIAACAILILSMFLHGLAGRVLWVLALILLVCAYFRIFSRKISKRQKENEAFQRLLSPFTRWRAKRKDHRRQKNLYSFFKCPQCGTVLRVPSGKGRIRITCKNCGTVFERNS